MSEDDEEDPFEQFEDVSDREGDPFDSLDGPESETTETDETGAGDVWDSHGDDRSETGEADTDPTRGSWDAEEPSTIDSGTDPGEQHTGAPGAAGGSTDPLAGGAGTAGRSGGDESTVETSGDGPGVRTDSAEPTIETDSDDPFADVGGREGDPFEADDSAFQRMDVGDIDPDSVWEDLSEAEERGSVTQSKDHVYAEVSKHSFCEHCEYFSAPPDVACSHEGTEILEFVDMETVRLVDCPVVTERRELEDEQ